MTKDYTSILITRGKLYGEGGGGRGGYPMKLCSERLRPEVQSLIVINITFWTKGTTFV